MGDPPVNFMQSVKPCQNVHKVAHRRIDIPYVHEFYQWPFYSCYVLNNINGKCVRSLYYVGYSRCR